MATPKGMPSYAQGTKQAIAASKKETELTKKAAATPLAKAPAAAISNAAATANSKAQSYDVKKADQNAKNAQQASTIVKQVAKQAPTPTVDTFKKAMPAPTGVLGQVVDTTRSVFGLPPVSAEALAKQQPLTPQQSMNVYATGDVGKIQDYTKTNVTPMTDAEKQQAFIKAVDTRSDVLKDQGGTRLVPSSSTTLTNQAIQDVTQAQNVAKGLTSVSPSTQQSLGATLGEQAKQAALGSQPAKTELDTLVKQTYGNVVDTPVQKTQAEKDAEALSARLKTESTIPSKEQPSGAIAGELAKPKETVTPVTKTESAVKTDTKTDEGMKQIEAGIAASDAFTKALKEMQVQSAATTTTGQTPATTTTAEQAPTPRTGGVVTGTDKEKANNIPDGFKMPDGYTWNATLGQWESPDVWANTVKNRERMPQPAAEVPTPTPTPTTTTAEQGAVTEEPKLKALPINLPTGETTQPQPEAPAFENYPTQYARAQVEQQIAEANKELDMQTEEALRNRDMQAAENLQAYKRAINEAQNKGFMQNQQLMQQMAGRGLLTSGIAADAQVRLQMSMNENMRDVAVKNQQSLDKINADYKTAFDKVTLKRDKLESGRQADIDKIVKGIESDNREIQKLDLDYRKVQIEENKMLMNNAQDVLARYAKQGYDTSAFEKFVLAGDTLGLARAMASTTDPQLSMLGKDMAATIEKTNSDIILNKRRAEETAMATKQKLSQIDKQRADMTGFEHKNGLPVKGKDGKYIPTFEAKTQAEKARQKQQEVELKKQEARTKVTSKTPAQVKAMTSSQQLNYVQDAVGSLLQDETKQTQTGTDLYGRPEYSAVKTGKKVLDKADQTAFKEIMAELWSKGNIDFGVIRNVYTSAGLKAPTEEDMIMMSRM